MHKKIAVLSGDGIGPEVMAEAVRLLQAVGHEFGHYFEFVHGLVGGAAYDATGEHFPAVTVQLCRSSDAILFGSVGGPVAEASKEKWKNCEANSVLALRKTFSFNANIRPVRVYESLREMCPLRSEVIGDGIDIVFVRELIGDIYFGEHKRFVKNGLRSATDVAEYNEEQVASVARQAFALAQTRRKKVTSVDKANVLSTSKLWREVVTEVAVEFPDIELEHMLVDNCAMQIIKKPTQFDVIVTANLFGDILSDAAAILPGSLGLLPSAGLNAEGFGYYEPSGGSAPDIMGQGIANPIAQILSAAMMLKTSFGLNSEAAAIEQAVEKTLVDGFRTADIYSGSGRKVTTKEMADAVIARLRA